MKRVWITPITVWLAIALLAAFPWRAPADDASLDGIDVRWVMAGLTEQTGHDVPVRISPDARLKTGDKIKIYLKARQRCFFYLFHRGPDGRLQLLYPSSLPSEGLDGGSRLTVPNGEQWFELDAQTGTETFHVLVSSTRLRAIEALYQDYRRRADDDKDAGDLLLSAIRRLQAQQRPLTSKAERPLAIGGTIRGASDQQAGTLEQRLDHLAEDIAFETVFCRTYTIEHH